MSDRAYFQALHDTAKDCMMQAFYASAVRERNNGHLGPCQHPEPMQYPCAERSYGSTYYWTDCADCGARYNHVVQEPW